MAESGYSSATLPKVIKRGPDGPPPSHSSIRPAQTQPSVVSVPPKLGPAPKPNPIIPKEHVDANREARRIVAEAEEQAQQIIEAANAERDQTRQQGYEEGYQEALGAYTEQTTKALIEVRRKEAALEQEMIKLVRACVEKVLGQEVKLHPDAVAGIVRAALQDARQQREIIVRVHPDDVEALKRNKRRLLEVLARANDIELREDPSITRGGCIVLTELGMIDASLERQLAAIEAALDEELRLGAPDDGGGDVEESELDPEDEAGYGAY